MSENQLSSSCSSAFYVLIDSYAAFAATWTVNVGTNTGTRNAFDPASLTIAQGDTVNFVWVSQNHDVVSGDITTCTATNTPLYSGAPVNPPHTYTYTFNTAGTYPYFCTPHCAAGMTATITGTIFSPSSNIAVVFHLLLIF